MVNPVILIQVKNIENPMAVRNEAMKIVMAQGLEDFDASGSRALVWNDGNTEESLNEIVKNLGEIENVVLTVMQDPGLGIILPGDFG